jgi:uncharacterized membrane protein YbhN (UPF0104 family)
MTASAVEATRSPRPWLAWGLWLALSVALAVAVGNLAWSEILARLSRLRLLWVIAAIAANFAILPLWAAEWRLLVPEAFRVAYGRMFGIVAVTASVLNAVPFFAGEASAVGLLIARGGLSRSAAASVLALDQLLVALAKLLTLAAATFFVALPAWLRAGVLSLLVGFAVLLITLVALAHSWQVLQAWITPHAGRARSLIESIVAWGGHLDAIRQWRRAAPAVALAVLKKCAEIAAILATQLAFGLDPSLAAAVLIVASLAVTTLLPVSPANLGIYEATVFAAYRYLGVPADAAVGLAVVQHVCFLLPSIVTGYVVATLAQLRGRERATLPS